MSSSGVVPALETWGNAGTWSNTQMQLANVLQLASEANLHYLVRTMQILVSDGHCTYIRNTYRNTK